MNFDLLEDLSVTEILINGPNEIWIEREGKLESAPPPWKSFVEYTQFMRSVLDSLNADLSLQEPFCSGRVKNFRIQVIGPPVTHTPVASFRRVLPQIMPLSQWIESGSLTTKAFAVLQESIRERKNILIFGATGSGKTTLLSSLMAEVQSNERVILLEDIEELCVPNTSSLRLLSRSDTMGVLKDISLSDLIRHSLRMRPDRLALGEVRGPEAKDLLLALATGHKGSFGTLHAQSLNEALLRLEMLVQLGAPQWQTKSIRQLILLSLQVIIGIQKTAAGKREVFCVHQLTGLEDFGFLTEAMV